MKNKIIYIPPPDKSITIRDLVLSSLSDKKIKILNPLISEDSLNTIKNLRRLGAKIKINSKSIEIKGFGKYGAKKAQINVGESALLLRLLLPILLNQKFPYKINGQKTILRRSFKQDILIFKKMGAKIKHNNFKLPIQTYPSILKPLNFKTSSAQTKSALLIASLYSGPIKIKETFLTRDHTERILKVFGITTHKAGKSIYITKNKLTPKNIEVPGDISQAAVFITIALLLKKEIVIKNCGINPKRIGFLKAISEMGAKILFKNKKVISNEPIADIHIKPPKNLKPIVIKEDITTMIDEIMPLALIMAKAKGKSEIHHINLLKNKESDRFSNIFLILKKLGVRVKRTKNKLTIIGPSDFKKIKSLDPQKDHRVAMIGGLLKIINNPEIKIKDKDSVSKTYSSFWKDLRNYLGSIEKL
ncbi:MAG: hypothetical protein K6357_05960 [Elusimicrobiota bacterium]